MSDRRFTVRRVAELSIHPAIADDPRMEPDHPEYKAMKAAWRECPDQIPVLSVTPSGAIVDGRHRWWFAQDEGIETLHCEEVEESAVQQVILTALKGRNNKITPGQVAYLAYPRVKPAHKAAVNARCLRLQSGGKSPSGGAPTVKDMVAQLGIGLEVFYQAEKIHGLFERNPSLRKKWEPKIFDAKEPLGLGSVLQGIGGAEATQGKPKVKPRRNSAVWNFCVSWRNLKKFGRNCDKWSQEDLNQAEEAMKKNFVEYPTQMLDLISASLKAARKKKAAGE